MKQTVGRNDPCHCGSGKKYKHCHLKIEQAKAQEERAWESAAHFLRRDFILFAKEERFAESFAAGVALFFNNYYTMETAPAMSEPESLRFFDWFTYDYIPADRPRLIDVYCAEKAELMDEKESTLLDGWLAAGPTCAYTLIDTTGEGKQTLQLENLFDGSQHTVPESGGPGRAGQGDVLIARLLPFRGRNRISGAAGYLPADEAAELRPYILEAWSAFQEEHSEANWDGFLRRRGYLFAHYELEAARKAGRPAVARLDPNRPQSQAGRLVRRIRGRR